LKALRINRCASLVSLSAAFTLVAAAVMQATAAPAPQSALSRAASVQPVLSAQKPVAAPAAVRPASASIASTSSQYYQNHFPSVVPAYDPTMAKLHEMFHPNIATGHTSTGDPVILEAYSQGEVVQVTDAAGNVVRAPQSANDPNIGPNKPLTFTVEVNNDTATTTATNVYLQFKNPNSAYQGNDGLEHKVFATDGNDGDDGSSDILFNGGQGEPHYLYMMAFLQEKGASGGTEGTDQFLGIGFDASLPLQNNFDNTSLHNFQSLGQEYECQYLDPIDRGQGSISGYTGTSDATAADYGTPFYLAGFDDQAPGTFGVSGQAAQGVPTDANGAEWLQLHQVGTTGTTNGVPNQDLYQATWAPPHTPSDFYMDVIVVDNQHNWRIYDNVWGFSTQYFDPTTDNDILFVSDNTLGQKFVASALANAGLTNLRPVYYGAESALTDVSVNDLPTAVFDYQTPSGASAPARAISQLNFVNGGVFESGSGDSAVEFPDTDLIFSATGSLTPVINSLGFGSYSDNVTDDTGIGQYHLNQQSNQLPNGNTATDVPGTSFPFNVPQSQAYSIWRILSRGPLDPTLLTTLPTKNVNTGKLEGGYLPTTVSQPAVNDTIRGFTSPASTSVVVATRCVIWASPFTGDQPLNVTGSIDDPATQTLLRQYVASGGRLFMTGQEIATAITQGGQASNGAGGFVYDVLNGQYVSNGAGSDNQTLTGISGAGHPIAGDAYFNFAAPFFFDDRFSGYYVNNFTGNPVYTQPGTVSPLSLGSDYYASADSGTRDKWRTDNALTQLGPYVAQFLSSRVQGAISIVNPVNGAISDFTDGGGSGLIYKSNTTAGTNYGSKVVYASFGLEGLSNEYYEQTVPGGSVREYFTHNDRPNVMHNIVNWLRTGAYQGRIFLGNSTQQGVAGATVYLVPFGGATIPGPRQTYSATSSDGTDGNPVGYYHMDGVEPGTYQVVAYKSGYSEGISPTLNETALPFTVAGDTTVNNANININPLPPGSINGTVTNADGGAPIANATVTFTLQPPTSPPTTVTATTNASGVYNVAAPAGTYIGIATSTTPSGTSAPSPVFTVTSGSTVTENFSITTNPGTITGTVVDGSNGDVGLVGATVAFTLTSAPAGSAPATTTTTGTGGAFTSPGLPVGTYTVTASKSGYFDPTAPPTVTVVAGQPTSLAQPIVLQTASAATLTVTVTTAATPPAPLTNATVTVTDPAGATVAQSSNGPGGVYTIPVQEGTYTVTVADPPQYVTASRQITITTTTASLSFALASAPSLAAYPAGKFSLVSWPYLASFDAAFGTLTPSVRSQAFNWNASANMYRMESTGIFPVDEAHPGYGYFIQFVNTQNIYGNGSGGVTGTAPSGSTVTVPLNQGWNMIGTPSTSAISISRLGVLVNGVNTFPFDSAAAGPYNYVYPVLYGYNPTGGSSGTGAYVSYVSATGPYSHTTAPMLIQPFQGYWIYVFQGGLTLTIPTSGG
jgi:hypothetical protein